MNTDDKIFTCVTAAVVIVVGSMFAGGLQAAGIAMICLGVVTLIVALVSLAD